jgi:ubiquinone/menaquinone biosynthesis C-methylase UbiE
MPDAYTTISTAEAEVQEQLADVLDLRARDPQQRAMLDAYLGELVLPVGAHVLEIGSGTGAVTRVIAERAGVAQVVGIDPSPIFLLRARTSSGDDPRISFVQGDGEALPFDDGSFDAVVAHTTLCHVTDSALVLREARRVTMPGGLLAAFDGDYATTTVAIHEHDPLQSCVSAAIGALVHDPFLVRRLPALVRSAGWEPVQTSSHGYVETVNAQYMPTLIDRGADALVAAGALTDSAAAALKAEARGRVAAGTFFGHIAYASLIAINPSPAGVPSSRNTV